MKVPDFIKQYDPKNGRLLGDKDGITLDEIDLTRDIMDIKFYLKSDIEEKDIKYFLKIEEWSEDTFKILIDFMEPM